MDNDQAFELILHAGNSESASMLCMEAARESDFEEAKNQCRAAKEELTLAHQIQTRLIAAEASGENVEVGILMTHAQDHFIMASMLKEISAEFLNVYQELQKLKEKGGTDL